MELSPEFVTSLESIAGVNDKYFKQQWTLLNYGQGGGTSGEDANVVNVWNQENFGQGVLVAVVDDGADIRHPDLLNNLLAGGSYNYLTGSDDPSSTDPDSGTALHGTAVAGIIAAERNNRLGIAGVAPQVQFVAYNFLESNTDVTEVDAMTRNISSVFISNNSWGPGPVGYGHFRPSSSAWRTAIETGLSTGRSGKGTVYVLAAGNGAFSPLGELGDSANANGYANFYGVISVCAVDDRGEVALYSEPGANLWVCAPSSSGLFNRTDVTTTDISGALYGYNKSGAAGEMTDRDYTKTFGGTSAAAPMISGVTALILKERPELTWRDVRQVLARSARKNHASSALWRQNGATPPFNIHYDYGFGVVDATAAVELARTWTLVGPMQTHTQSQASGAAIDDTGTAATSDIVVAGSGITKIEYVEVTVDITHTDWGNLTIDLKRSGSVTTSSRLLVAHKCLNDSSTEIDCTVTGNTFRFGSARHLGEAADGTWTLEVFDGDALNGVTDGKTGTLTEWQIRIFGE